MSLKVPSLRFLLGIDTNKPFGPWMILMSVTTKHWSNTIDTKALSFSSSTGMTLTSVISMLSAPSGLPLHDARRSGRGVPGAAILIQGERPAAQGRESRRAQGRVGVAGLPGIVEQAEVRGPAPRKRCQKRSVPDQETPDPPH